MKFELIKEILSKMLGKMLGTTIGKISPLLGSLSAVIGLNMADVLSFTSEDEPVGITIVRAGEPIKVVIEKLPLEPVTENVCFTSNSEIKNNRWRWTKSVQEVRLSPYANYVALYRAEQNELSIYKISTGQLLSRIANRKYLFDVQFSSVGAFVALKSARSASLYQCDQFSHLQKISDEDQINAVALSPNGNYMAVGVQDAKTTKLYSKANEGYLTPISHEIGAHVYEFSPDSKYLAVADYSGRVKIYDIEQDSRCAFDIGGQRGDLVECLTFTHDSKNLLMGCKDRMIKSYSLAKLGRYQDRTAEIVELENKIISLSICSKRKYLAIGHENNAVTLFSMDEGKILDTIEHNDDIMYLAFSHNGKYLATASSDTTAKLYSICDQQIVATIHHGGGLGDNSLVFTSDNRYLVSASKEELVVTDLEECE